MARTRRRTPTTALAAAVIVMVAVLAAPACASGSDSMSGDDSGGFDSGGGAADPELAHDRSTGDADSAGSGSPDAGTATLTAAQEVTATGAAARKQTFDAVLEVRVDTLGDAITEASEAIVALGGFVSNEDIDVAETNRATVVYRVPAARFREALTAVADVGELRSQTIDSNDVTAQYADLEGRVTTLRTSIDRLHGFLGEATDVNQIASLEGELTRREAELESIESQRRVLAEQVELSTITATYGATTVDAVVASTERPGFLGGLEAGWNVALDVAAIALAALGFVLPFLPFVAVVIAAIVVLRRRARRNAPAPLS